MGTVNLGRVRDRVTGVERINGNGSAGTIDTYRVSFESSNYYDFNVTNGRNGVGQIVSFSGDSDSRNNLIVRIVNNQDKVLALLVKSNSESEVNDGYMQASFKVEKTLYTEVPVDYLYGVTAYSPAGSQLFIATYKQSLSNSEPRDFEISFSSGFENCLNAWCLLYYNDSSTGITVDDELSDNSTNPVQNKVIAKFANEVVENKANVDGNYQTMTVGNANNLIATKGLEVESYFTFEKTGGEQASAIESGNGTLKNLYGKTEKSENLLILDDFAETTLNGITYSVSNGVLTLSGTATAFTRIDLVTDFSLKLSDNSYTLVNLGDTWNWGNGFYLGSSYSGEDIQFNKNVATQTKTFTEEKEIKFVYITIANGVSISNKTIKPMLVKGSTAPTTFIPYYDGLKHTHITGLKSAGINQWDEEWENGVIYENGTEGSDSTSIRSKNICKCIPNTTYYCKTPSNTFICWYDSQNSFISRTSITNTTSVSPTNAFGFRLSCPAYGTTYNHDICINFSSPNINGNYYPYEEETLNIDFEGNGVGTVSDEINVEEGKKYQRFGIVDLGTLNWTFLNSYGGVWYSTQIASLVKRPANINTKANMICDKYDVIPMEDIQASQSIGTAIYPDNGNLFVNNGSSTTTPTGSLVYELAEPIVTDVEIPKDTIKVWNGGSMEALGTEVPVGTKIFYQKNIKAFVEAFGEAIDWNPERIERLAKLSITPEYVNISLNPSQANAYAVAQVYNATFTIVISTALTGTPNGEITFQDSEIDLSSFATQPAESIYDMDGKKVSEEPTTEDCNIASFVGRSYNGIVLWSLLHSGVNKVKVHFEQAIPLDSEGNGKLDCRASLIL